MGFEIIVILPEQWATVSKRSKEKFKKQFMKIRLIEWNSFCWKLYFYFCQPETTLFTYMLYIYDIIKSINRKYANCKYFVVGLFFLRSQIRTANKLASLFAEKAWERAKKLRVLYCCIVAHILHNIILKRMYEHKLFIYNGVPLVA